VEDITSSFEHCCRRRVAQRCKMGASLCFHVNVLIIDYIVDITSLVRKDKDSVRILQKTPFTHDVYGILCQIRTESLYATTVRDSATFIFKQGREISI
jgi:hypothetical protein